MSLDHLWLSFDCSLFWFFDWGRRTTIWRAPLRQAGCRMAAPAESPWCWAAVDPHGWPASFDVSSGCVEWWWGCLDSSIWPNVVAHATILVHSWGNLNFVWRFICVLFAMFLSIPIVAWLMMVVCFLDDLGCPIIGYCSWLIVWIFLISHISSTPNLVIFGLVELNSF